MWSSLEAENTTKPTRDVVTAHRVSVGSGVCELTNQSRPDIQGLYSAAVLLVSVYEQVALLFQNPDTTWILIIYICNSNCINKLGFFHNKTSSKNPAYRSCHIRLRCLNPGIWETEECADTLNVAQECYCRLEFKYFP